MTLTDNDTSNERLPVREKGTEYDDDASSIGIDEVQEEEKFGVLNQICWWLLGLFNNLIWVIAYASAGEITSTSYGLTYLANSAPCLIVCIIAPYTLHLIPYEVRMAVAGFLGIAAMVLIALPGVVTMAAATGTAVQLVGVTLVSIQCQLGECTLLPYAGAYGGKKARRYISWYSSGTGGAGIVGTFYPVLMEEILGLSLSTAVLIGLVFPVAYVAIFFLALDRRGTHDSHIEEQRTEEQDFSSSKQVNIDIAMEEGGSARPRTSTSGSPSESWHMERTKDQGWSFAKRFKEVLGLWHYIVPLFVVYFAEYFIQSGLWSSIGVPDLYSQEDRNQFYHYAAIAYQVGVFISRSSGLIISPNYTIIAAMPLAQLCMVGLFAAIAATQFWTGWTLLIPAVLVGLWGGASYCLTYVHIANNVPADKIEFSVAATTVAENLGSTLSAFTAMYVQGCMWKRLGIPGGLSC